MRVPWLEARPFASALQLGGDMKRVRWSVLALCTTAACVVHFTPSVTPQKLRPVTPPIRARALLLITPSFEQYVAREKNGVKQVFHYGEAGSKSLSTLVTQSFTAVEIRHVATEDVQPLLAGPADTSVADILLVPSFENAGARLRLTAGDPYYVPLPSVSDSMAVSSTSGDISAGVTLRVNARSLHTGRVFAWVASGGSGPLHASWGRASGLALENALHVLSDSLAAHRAQLEP